MKRIHLVNFMLGGACVAVAYVVGVRGGAARMYVKQIVNVQRAIAGSCEYKVPAEDRKLSCEGMARMAAYRELLKLERKMKEEDPW